MNDPIPHAKCDHVLAGVKAKPFGWPPANPDTDSGRGPSATSGTRSRVEQNRQNQVSTVSGDC
ncbi:hypothetical protein, partial [Ornithinimicrobium cryptoxanthini]|uniref:hypothetical protein n=1 Tax=Ornithinimicrobium cryptoxanthini TaxID=2934161 RepID=UPI0021178A1C